MGKEKGGWKYRRTDAEYKWGKEEANKIMAAGMKIGKKAYREFGVFEAYEKKFGKKIQDFQLTYILKKAVGIRGKSKKPNLTKVMEQAKYILYIFNEGIYGYDTKEEVKSYLAQRVNHVPIRLFENIPAEIKVKVDVVI